MEKKILAILASLSQDEKVELLENLINQIKEGEQNYKPLPLVRLGDIYKSAGATRKR